MSGQLRIISDLHFGHESMAIKRGFVNSIEHDQHIIDCWNSVVRKGDTVWILGDITMEKSQPYILLNQLKGFKKVILGNHDKPQHVSELLKYVNLVCGMFKLNGYMMSHAPIHSTELASYGMNIHGHVHENTIDDSRYINVSAEAINYTPIQFPRKFHFDKEHQTINYT